MTIDSLEKAEEFVKNLKRSDNWISNEELLTKLNDSYKLILDNSREDLIPFVTVNITLYYIDIGEYENAWKYTEQARIFAEKYNNYECLLNAISLQYRIQRYFGNIELAQELVNQQIEFAYKVNMPMHIFGAYVNQANIFNLQNLKKECIDALEKALFYVLKGDNKYYISMVYNNLSSHLVEYNLLDKAKGYLNKAYKIGKENNYINMLALTHSNFGIFYQKTKDAIKSERHLRKSIKLFHQLKNINEETQAKMMLIDSYLAFKKFSQAEKIIQEVMEYSENSNQKSNLIYIYQLYSTILEEKEDYKNALIYFKKHKIVNEEINNAESEKKLKNLEFQQKIDILNIEKNSAEKMAAIKQDFLANMSHEIRSPINSILGICYLLQQQSLNIIQNDYVDRLKRSGENLLGIINDVLDISKIESGKMVLILQPFSLNTLLQDILNNNEPRALEKQLNFSINKKYKDDLILNGDIVRLQQVITNLISNAIKFTEKGNVSLHITPTESSNNKIEIQFIVTDTGIGIQKDKIDKIFERYEQATAAIKNTFGGTGLGLSISKKIIELMNGTIEIKSKLEKGSKFIVTIPFQKQTKLKVEKQNEISDPSVLNYKSILIADDNVENRLVAKEILQNLNNTMVFYEAENGKEAIKIIKNTPIDILFIDLDMPVMNGIEAVQRIRRNKKYNTIKIIGNTASLSSLSYEEITAIGFDDFVFKPYKAEELIGKIYKF